jgi:GT2 family glycosyltransferase
VKVSAIVVTWDSAEDVGACLASLDAQDHPDLEVLVLDNASSDATVRQVETFAAVAAQHEVSLVRHQRNLGFCGAVNRGIAATSGDAVLLVNPDAVLETDAVRRMVAVLEQYPRCGSVQPKLLRPQAVTRTGGRSAPTTSPAAVSGAAPAPALAQRDVIDTTGHVLTRPRLVLNRGSGEPDDGRYDTPGEVFGASGAAVLHRRTMLDDIARQLPSGALEHLTEDLVAYFDDVELDLRARMRGWTARYEPSAVGRHARAGASQRRGRRVRQLNLANHLLVILGTEAPRSLLRDVHLVIPMTLLRLCAGLLRSPLATLGALVRLRLLPRALRRGRADRGRATVDPSAAIARWIAPVPPGWLRASVGRALR